MTNPSQSHYRVVKFNLNVALLRQVMNTKYEAKYFSPIPALVCDLVFTRTVELVHLLIFPFVPVQLKGWPERIGSIKNVSLETRVL